jgi:serine/threonine-protein kinase
MGRVYEALDLEQRRNVAIKILHSEVMEDAVHVQRFEREYEVSRQLGHEHIVEVMDLSRLPDGAYAMVMEFLFGEELSQALLREKFVSPARLVRMTSQMALALDPAHQSKLVHRDLKPDNVFLCQTPQGDNIKLLDFGSAKDRKEGAKQLTVLGTTIGSPHYMSPEQVQGLDTLDHRADVWALGVIVYQCISGALPFSGSGIPELLLSIMSREVPPLGAVASPKFAIPKKMDSVLRKALSKTPSLRYESIGALADAIGWSYGLEGSHHGWATEPESQLARAITSRGQGPSQVPSFPARPSPQDDFFGDADSLCEASLRPPRVGAMAQGLGNVAARSDGGESLIPGIPRSGVSPWFFVVVLAIMTLAVAFLFLLK